MPKFCQIRQNPPRAAKFRGMDHCVCCANSTLSPKIARVSKNGRKGGKKTLNVGGGSSGRSGADPKESQVTPQHQAQGPKGEPSGQGAQRCHEYHPCGCTAKVVKSGGDSCPNWNQVRKYDPKLSDTLEDIQIEGVGEDWWEVLFEDIGILPAVQSPLNAEHTYALEDFQGTTSGGR